MAMARPATRKAHRPRHSAARRHLRVIPGGKPDAGARALKPHKASLRLVVAASITLAALVFGLVLLNIYLAQSSFELADLERDVARQEERYRQMRLQVATAESPEKIAAAAAGIGLVAPEQQGYILGRQQVRVAQAPTMSSEEEGIKAVLGARP